MSQSWIKRKFQAFELYTVDVVLGRRADTGAVIFGTFLQASPDLQRHRAAAPLALPQPYPEGPPARCLVVVVGNLTVGGTARPLWWRSLQSAQDRPKGCDPEPRYKSKTPPFWKKAWYASRTPMSRRPLVSDGQTVLLESEEAATSPTCSPGTCRVVVLVDKNGSRRALLRSRSTGATPWCSTTASSTCRSREAQPPFGRQTNPFGNGTCCRGHPSGARQAPEARQLIPQPSPTASGTGA